MTVNLRLIQLSKLESPSPSAMTNALEKVIDWMMENVQSYISKYNPGVFADLENQLQVNLNILRKHNLLPGAETILPATSPADIPAAFPEEDAFDPFGSLPNADTPSV